MECSLVLKKTALFLRDGFPNRFIRIYSDIRISECIRISAYPNTFGYHDGVLLLLDCKKRLENLKFIHHASTFALKAVSSTRILAYLNAVCIPHTL